MYRQIFKKSFFYSFQSNQTRYFTAYLDSSRAEKKKKKKKKINLRAECIGNGYEDVAKQNI